ncbi:MAG: BamA/TamA family outer membrane protein, partial [Nitrospiraceae bacterium]|nr:BamA/TamA family outer membrane protein [Nitrospiraceae bacterium]
TAMIMYAKKGAVRTLLAPQIHNNRYYGVTGTMYGALYPRAGQSWQINLSRSQHVNFDSEITFRDIGNIEKNMELNAYGYYFDNGSARFFGFHSGSLLANQTNYGDEEAGFTLSDTFGVLPRFYVSVGERLRKVTVTKGAVATLPFIGDVFTPQQVPGINGFVTDAQGLSLIYCSLDSREMPTQGLYARAEVEWSRKFMGSSANFTHYMISAKDFMPSSGRRYITVVRGVYNQTVGHDVPFLERSILGGEDTLRGYGDNRFIDDSYLLFNFEERIRLFTRSLFNVRTEWQLAPFLDAGAVMHTLLSIRAKDFKLNPGIGFRATVPPDIVGRVDVGVGNEGPAVFVGLGYPF